MRRTTAYLSSVLRYLNTPHRPSKEPDGIGACAPLRTPVLLLAVLEAGSAFASWGGCDASGEAGFGSAWLAGAVAGVVLLDESS